MSPPAEGADLSRVARGGALNVAGAVVGAALNTGLIVLVARAFPQDTAGLLFSLTSVFLIAAAVADLGASTGLVYFVARLRALGGAGRIPHLLRQVFGPVAVVSVAVAAALFACADDVARLVGAEGAVSYVRLLAVFLPFAVVTDAALAATRGLRDMGATVLVGRVGRPLAQVALVAGVAVTGGAGLLVVAWAGPYLPAAVVAWFWLRRIVRRARSGESPDDAAGPVTPAAFWSFTLPRSVATIAQLGIQRSGIVLVAAMQGGAAAAVFTAATRLPVVGQFGAQAIQFAAQPRLAELLAVDDRRAAGTLYRASTAWLICLTWPLFLPAIVYAPLVMRLFGPDYAEGAGALVVIAAAQLGSTAMGMGDTVLTMAGRTGWNLVNNGLALLVNILLCLALIPGWGALGAAMAWAAAIAVRNVLPVAQLSRSLGLHPFGRGWLIAVAVCLVWFGALPLACAAVLGSGPVSLAVALTAGGAGHVATLWLLRGPLRLEGLLRPRRTVPVSRPEPAPSE
ncbi:polysaccharide biosynthesis C-terminal domain-containing protein [Nocardiopsis mangrovi]|uniref:Polysaccharide biosynthesis C-terminal domain-containing protein n=1 Tax=Nocardiopsis mangrovi TaxID=1179818 RepID=A0ABV9DVB5_9ACTN